MGDAEPTIVLPQLTQPVTPRWRYALSTAGRAYVDGLCDEKVANCSKTTIALSSEPGGDMPDASEELILGLAGTDSMFSSLKPSSESQLADKRRLTSNRAPCTSHLNLPQH